jgi:methylenetetrahydrofolate--tRNA-(uracil-5-)-methyltransferase
MIGGLLRYVSGADPKRFQPMNANFGLLPPPEGKIRGKLERRKFLAKRALEVMEEWLKRL